MLCLETESLSYQFSSQDIVLKNVSLRVPVGAIYGFLGPNGAGKTTTLRLILGLLRRQHGSVRIFQKSFDRHRIEILGKLGSLIESSSLYSHLTAVENLRVLQRVYQCPESRINKVLQIVGLRDVGEKKIGNFSLGMKQRLGIAMALLHEPLLLILDEPTNGLDPNGIIEIRELLKELNGAAGVTVLISSHVLPEIEKLVTHLGIIHQGTLLFQGTLADLQERQTSRSVISIETNNPHKTLEILVAGGCVARRVGDQIMIPLIEKEILARFNRQLVHAGIDVFQIRLEKHDLESIFIEMVKN